MYDEKLKATVQKVWAVRQNTYSLPEFTDELYASILSGLASNHIPLTNRLGYDVNLVIQYYIENGA